MMSPRLRRSGKPLCPDAIPAHDSQRDLNRLGQLLQRSRQSAKLRQQDLADCSGVAQADISRLEAGLRERGPTFDTLLRLARAQNMKLVVELVPVAERVPVERRTRGLREAF
jgi:transcriptional regulator with XRE-family HTH domain